MEGLLTMNWPSIITAIGGLVITVAGLLKARAMYKARIKLKQVENDGDAQKLDADLKKQALKFDGTMAIDQLNHDQKMEERQFEALQRQLDRQAKQEQYDTMRQVQAENAVIENLKAQLAELRNELDLQREEMKQLTKRLDRLVSENSALRAENVRLETKLEYAEKEAKRLAEELETAEKDRDHYHSKYKTLKGMVAKNNQSLTELSDEVSQAQEVANETTRSMRQSFDALQIRKPDGD